jgi:hypothetical protein
MAFWVLSLLWLTAAGPGSSSFSLGDAAFWGESAKPSVDSIVKIGARVVYHARKWHVHVVSAFSLASYYRILFARSEPANGKQGSKLREKRSVLKLQKPVSLTYHSRVRL